MATIYNKIDYHLDLQKEMLTKNLNIAYGLQNGELDVVIGGKGQGRSVAVSVLEEHAAEKRLEEKYPALAQAREQYNIIKALCQGEENGS